MTCKHPSDGRSTATEEACCTTACLVQPRFFHGQLLTDADLNQLLSWAENKFRLQRAINGWGIVCGLQLSLDPEHPTHILVLPGQAIDCCGRDLVVCEPISVDLSDACPKEECLGPSYNRWGKTTREADSKTSAEGAYEQPEVKPLSLHRIFEGSEVLDLFLYYSSEGDDSQVRLGGQGSECEYSRMKETVTLKWETESDPQAVDGQRLDNFIKAYEGLRLANLERIRIARAKADNQESLRSWLLGRLDVQPVQEFGFVRDWISGMEASEIANNAARILFFMNMDALLAGLPCACPGCSSETGLRVGRAWLQGPSAGGGDSCRIIFVSNQPPYRRELHSDSCYPSPTGCINLAPYLWQDWLIVKDSLTKMGVPVGQPYVRRFDELNWETLEELHKQTDRIVNCDEHGNPLPVRASIVDLEPPFGSRVIGFTF